MRMDRSFVIDGRDCFLAYQKGENIMKRALEIVHCDFDYLIGKRIAARIVGGGFIPADDTFDLPPGTIVRDVKTNQRFYLYERRNGYVLVPEGFDPEYERRIR